jgi:nitroimidazol reductase NimA-like FMN-containing flavoprotein (pyridoxamine 5'-phosphate oxidase superfamily)
MKKRALSNPSEINDIIRKCQVCHIAMVDQKGLPYVLPFNFGYEDSVIYLHSSKHGKKIDILKNNNNVCIAFNTDHLLRYQSEDVACSYTMKYRSVLATGKAEFIEDPDQKMIALNFIMKQYTPKEFQYNPPSVKEVCCWKVVIDKIEGRVYGY